jgi:hypothetical protein
LKRLIKKILKEDQRERYLNKIINFMRNDFPLFKNMETYGFTEQLSEEELNYVFSGIFGEPVVRDGYYVTSNTTYKDFYFERSDGSSWKKWEYDDNGNQIYYESSNGNWVKSVYDEYGNEIYISNSEGGWKKMEFDINNRLIYNEDSDGTWVKREYDDYGNLIYEESYNGYWMKREYNENGDILYFENSLGHSFDKR